MAQSSSRRSSGPVLQAVSPAGKFCSAFSQPSSGFAASSAGFSSHSTSFFQRSASPTRVNLYSSPSSSSSIRFSIDHHRSISPGRSIAALPAVPSRDRQVLRKPAGIPQQKRTCMCSPTTHPGSFRCSLHKGCASAVSSPSNRLNARRSAMTNSLVRIGTVEGEWVKRALATLIRPSSHSQRRRAAFQPRPSRLSVMSKAAD